MTVGYTCSVQEGDVSEAQKEPSVDMHRTAMMLYVIIITFVRSPPPPPFCLTLERSFSIHASYMTY